MTEQVHEPGRAWTVAVCCLTRGTWWRFRMRVRQWGRLPLRRGPTVLVANHQHEDESEIICERAWQQGPWRRPIYTASSRRMYEPGFFATRLPALRFARTWNAGPMFMALGLLPLENELSSRPFGSLAFDISRRHGDLPLAEIFRDDALALVPGAERCSDLAQPAFFEAAQKYVKLSWLREPYRREAIDAVRSGVDEDIARIKAIVARGATFYVTPEGFYTTDGRMRPLRGIITHLTPIADVWLAAIAFDPFRRGRLSMLYRVVRPADSQDLATSLPAARPVTTSALVATRLHQLGDGETIGRDELVDDVVAALRGLPRDVFVDPELARRPAQCVDEVVSELVRRGTLTAAGANRYALGGVRTSPRFPGVADLIAYQAAFHEETIAAARRIAGE